MKFTPFEAYSGKPNLQLKDVPSHLHDAIKETSTDIFLEGSDTTFILFDFDLISSDDFEILKTYPNVVIEKTAPNRQSLSFRTDYLLNL